MHRTLWRNDAGLVTVVDGQRREPALSCRKKDRTMSTQCVINLDLADVWDKRGRKSLRRTVAWGDEITVTDQKITHLEVEITSFKTGSDGSLIPSTRGGFIEPTKASRIKPGDIIVPRE
jgi:hypothetical protein